MTYTLKDGIELFETTTQIKGKEIDEVCLNDILECLRDHSIKKFLEFEEKNTKGPSPAEKRGMRMKKEREDKIKEAQREDKIKEAQKAADELKQQLIEEANAMRMKKEREDKIKEAQKAADELEQQLIEEEANASKLKKIEIKKKTKAKKGNPYPKMITIAKDTGIKALNPDWVKWEKENK